MQQLVLIALGGALGALARYGVSTFVYAAASELFPWGTLVVNLTGCFLIGIVAELFGTALVPGEWRSFIAIGFIGAYTTFSTYSLETINLLREGELRLAAWNVLSNNVLGLLLVILGLYVSRLFLKLLP